MLDRRWPSYSLGWFVLIALLVHVAVLQFTFFHQPLPNLADGKTKTDDKAIEVTPYDPKTDPHKPVVQTEEAVKQEPDDKPARFVGEVRNRVKQESRAEHSGRFQQGQRIPTVPYPSGPGEGGAREDKSFSDLLAFPQSPNAVPGDVARGAQTLLNTDPVLYAGFINRVADEIYDAWVAHAGVAVDKVYAAGGRLGAAVYITKLTVVLNRSGEVASLRVLKSSGVNELDEAPKDAFWDSEPFPNPPTQMFDDDGLVRFVYEFHFEWKSSGFNIVPLI